MTEHTATPFKLPKFKDMIIYEDENLIVVNKPAFLSSLDERAGQGDSLLRLAKRYDSEIQVCHRLDKETSGLILLARNSETYRAVSIEFEKRRVSKIYHALIGGVHHFDNLLVDLPILNQGNKNVSIDRARGKDATTYFRSLRFFRNYTLVECRPVTGRMHQIRIHLATQRASIVGDAAYRGKPIFLSQIKRRGYSLSKGQVEQPIMKRFALHAHALSLTLNGMEYSFEAPYPKDFATLLKLLEKFDT